MNPIVVIIAVLIVLFWIRFSYERQRCSAHHARWGRCTRKPYHWPHPHTGSRGGGWR